MHLALLFLMLGSTGSILLGEESGKKPTVKMSELRAELLRRVEADQAARKNLVRFMKEHGKGGAVVFENLDKEQRAEFERIVARVRKIDKESTERLKAIVEKQGWPTVTMVGKDGAHAAWLLVQHADAQPKFQRRCLDLMTELPKDEVSQSDVAYLTDRVLLAEGRKQLYGTQVEFKEGAWKPKALQDPEKLDERRAKMGLSSFAEYVKLISSQFGK